MLRPLSSERWNFTTAAHLLNRAGFGGPPSEIERLAAMGPAKAVGSLLDYEAIPEPIPPLAWMKSDLERAAKLQAIRDAAPEEKKKLQQEEQQGQQQHLQELRGWWLRRMAEGARPFQEKMVLFWHGHFATSVQKVRDPYLMWRQNDIFRRFAVGNWLEMLIAAGKDPAMLIWLDQGQSRKQHPNENFAREVMELFALGEGHYTEKDVTEAARALTGWALDPASREFIERPAWHDTGQKTVLGKTGNFRGEDVLEQIVALPQSSRFITSKLWNFFAGAPPSEEVASALTVSFQAAGHHFKPVLREMFLSEEFYSPSTIRNQVKSPVQWLVGSIRTLERPLPTTQVCCNLIRNLGQDLFAPPNVKGWDGGLSWITTNTLLARYNQAAILLQNDRPAASADTGQGKNSKQSPASDGRPQNGPVGGVEVDRLISPRERMDIGSLIASLERRFLQAQLSQEQNIALRQYLGALGNLNDTHVLNAVRMVMSTPEYQIT